MHGYDLKIFNEFRSQTLYYIFSHIKLIFFYISIKLKEEEKQFLCSYALKK